MGRIGSPRSAWCTATRLPEAPMRGLSVAVVIALALWSCAKARPQQGTLAHPVSWEEDVSPVFAAQCNSCHSGAAAAGGYRTTSYLEALGPTSAPVAVAGDAPSLLLRTIDPATADAVHMPVSAVHAQASEWVVPGKLSFFRSGTHQGGILNPNDPEFHKNLVAERGWNFKECQNCHGADLAGGKAGVSCQECHSLQIGQSGLTTCTSCHGDQSPTPPRDLTGSTATTSRGVGAHQAHL